MRAAICFSQFGPYHHARANFLRDELDNSTLFGVQVAANSKTYAWDVDDTSSGNLVTLCTGAEEDVSFVSVFLPAWRFWKRERIEAAFLPSYSPSSSLALLLSAKFAGVKCIMMNESHAGTERATGLKRRLKRFLVSLFDGAIVGGEPHRRYFESLGMKADRIVTGYDAIDNAFFSEAAGQARRHSDEVRGKLSLPKRYLLSLGRMVEKKNLSCLVSAYSDFRQADKTSDLKLVFVGSGECQDALVSQCKKYNLKYTLDPASDDGTADVLFYGFRQIDENPVFYALSEAFILPSLYEEWGLVVNEAMACGLPVIVSETVGSAEDLVVPELNGFHFNPNSVAELSECIRRLDCDPGLRSRMGKASLERIKDWGCENFAANAKMILDRVMA